MNNSPKLAEYKLSDLFYSVCGDKDIQKSHINGRGHYVVTSGLFNYGIAGKTDVQAKIIPEKTISIDMFGNVFYREYPYKMVTHARVFALIPKEEDFDEELGLYISSCLLKLNKIYSYNNMCSWDKIKNLSIFIPVNKNRNIDISYIKRIVSEIKTNRIDKIKHYLKNNSLDDLTLNKQDKEILSKKIATKQYKLSDIFEWSSQKEIDPLKIKSLKTVSDTKYPFYGQATINNGIIDYLSLDEKVLNNKDGKPTILIHSNNQNIVYLETPFYLKDGHGATSILQSNSLNEAIALYLITSIKKVISKKFTYQNKATKIALKNTEIELPINDDGEIDYDYMEQYIRIIEKISISKIQNIVS